MKERAGKKKVVLELGGNAGVIVDKTRRPRLGGQAAASSARSRYAGQVCISVQRMFIHEDDLGRVHGPVRRRRRGRSRSAIRSIRRPTSARWSTSTAAGADPALGRRGGRDGRQGPRSAARPTARSSRRRSSPTCRLTAQVCSNEAFAPLVVAFPFRDFDDAIAQVNDSLFGLQTGVFTNDLAGAWRAFNELEVGGVIVNDVPTYRIDHMPYGGVKDSGLGREGLRWAIEDMTEIRIMVLAQPG